jgi:oligosaccharide repeat unit polymerase
MKRSFFDPRLIFLVIWISQAILHAVDYAFNPFSYITWIVMAVAVVAFILGSGVGSAIKQKKVCLNDYAYYSDRYIKTFIIFLYFLYAIALVYAVIKLEGLLGLSGAVGNPASDMRLVLINDFLGERLIFNYLRVFYFGVGLSIFALAFAPSLSRSVVVTVVLFGLLTAIATTGRLYLLLFVVSGSALLHRHKIISNKGLVIFGSAFVLLFFLMAFIFDKGEAGASISESVAWNAKVYMMSSLACFNDYVQSGVQNIPGGAIVPDFLRPLLNQLGFSFEAKPNLLPFAYVPEPCNTYTVLFPYYHDLGVFGVAIFMFIVGIIHQYLYEMYRRTRSPIKLYLYAISLYPLSMMIFEEAYISSIGFWLFLLILPICFSGVHWFLRCGIFLFTPKNHAWIDKSARHLAK